MINHPNVHAAACRSFVQIPAPCRRFISLRILIMTHNACLDDNDNDKARNRDRWSTADQFLLFFQLKKAVTRYRGGLGALQESG